MVANMIRYISWDIMTGSWDTLQQEKLGTLIVACNITLERDVQYLEQPDEVVTAMAFQTTSTTW